MFICWVSPTGPPSSRAGLPLPATALGSLNPSGTSWYVCFGRGNLLADNETEPESDTEITLNGISLVDKIMSKHPAVLFELQPPQLLEFFFLFTLKVLNGKELLPKCAAADFWVSKLLPPLVGQSKEKLTCYSLPERLHHPQV